MDINAVLHFISGQIEKIIGVVAALFIATTALLIFRSIKDEKKNGADGHGGTDAGAIEDALRRVLSQTSVMTRTESSPDDGVLAMAPVGGGTDDEKDERIATLQTALQKAQALLKERMEASVSEGAEGVEAGSGAADVALKKEVDELRARLSEYEIIEDDIADLAMFKEENMRLKQEVDSLKTSGPTAAAPQAIVVGEPLPETTPQIISGDAGDPSAQLITGAASEKVDDPFAALMTEAQKQQDAAVAAEKPAIDDASNPTKMALDAQALADQALKSLQTDDQGVEVLSNLVDTDKLMDEVNALDAEDLMSEFKDKGKP